MGWHFTRLDLSAGYAFVAPTGRYTLGSRDNVGSGYWGNNLISGATFYITKNKGTSANVFVDWEAHGQKSGTNITPGQAFTIEWGLGQAPPLDKQLSKIVQIGLVGFDQWQVTDNSGITSLLPYYSAHALGAQGSFILPKPGLSFFFKYYGE
ncbi:MAG: transporter [Candidatus Acidiferrum sp.]